VPPCIRCAPIGVRFLGKLLSRLEAQRLCLASAGLPVLSSITDL